MRLKGARGYRSALGFDTVVYDTVVCDTVGSNAWVSEDKRRLKGNSLW
ncbi:hypothetical protein [Shewanella sp. GXUN23E]